jgi:hypothetical protein
VIIIPDHEHSPIISLSNGPLVHRNSNLMSPTVVVSSEIPSQVGRENATSASHDRSNSSPRVIRVHKPTNELIPFSPGSPSPLGHSTTTLSIQTDNSPLPTERHQLSNHHQSGGGGSFVIVTREAAAIAAAEQLVIGSIPTSPPMTISSTSVHNFTSPVEGRSSATSQPWSPLTPPTGTGASGAVATSIMIPTPPNGRSPRALMDRPSSFIVGGPTGRRSLSFSGTPLMSRSPNNNTTLTGASGVPGSPRLYPRFAYATSVNKTNNNGSGSFSPIALPVNRNTSLDLSPILITTPVATAAALLSPPISDTARSSTSSFNDNKVNFPLSPPARSLEESSMLSLPASITPIKSSTATKVSRHNVVLGRSDIVQSPSPELSSSSLINDKQVMISYSHKDQEFAKKIAASLKEVRPTHTVTSSICNMRHSLIIPNRRSLKYGLILISHQVKTGEVISLMLLKGLLLLYLFL